LPELIVKKKERGGAFGEIKINAARLCR